jgi:hypothetical protein
LSRRRRHSKRVQGVKGVLESRGHVRIILE